MKKSLPLCLFGILFISALIGCSGGPAGDPYEEVYLDEAPGVRITGEAYQALTGDSEAYTLSYTQRTS